MYTWFIYGSRVPHRKAWSRHWLLTAS